jgi:hypothetical protein
MKISSAFKTVLKFTIDYSWMLMICAGRDQMLPAPEQQESSVIVPSAILPLLEFFYNRLNESIGSCSNNPGMNPSMSHNSRMSHDQ